MVNKALITERMRSARILLGESQARFAKRLGVNQGTLSRWEQSGVPAYVVVGYMVAEILRVCDADYSSGNR